MKYRENSEEESESDNSERVNKKLTKITIPAKYLKKYLNKPKKWEILTSRTKELVFAEEGSHQLQQQLEVLMESHQKSNERLINNFLQRILPQHQQREQRPKQAAIHSHKQKEPEQAPVNQDDQDDQDIGLEYSNSEQESEALPSPAPSPPPPSPKKYPRRQFISPRRTNSKSPITRPSTSTTTPTTSISRLFKIPPKLSSEINKSKLLSSFSAYTRNFGILTTTKTRRSMNTLFKDDGKVNKKLNDLYLLCEDQKSTIYNQILSNFDNSISEKLPSECWYLKSNYDHYEIKFVSGSYEIKVKDHIRISKIRVDHIIWYFNTNQNKMLLAYPSIFKDRIENQIDVDDDGYGNGLQLILLCGDSKCLNYHHMIVQNKQIKKSRQECIQNATPHYCPHAIPCIGLKILQKVDVGSSETDNDETSNDDQSSSDESNKERSSDEETNEKSSEESND